jgi:hypothetical protein
MMLFIIKPASSKTPYFYFHYLKKKNKIKRFYNIP